MNINSVKLKVAKELITPPQCPDCGDRSVRIIRKRYVDFYGCPVVLHCDCCKWEKEITAQDIENEKFINS